MKEYKKNAYQKKKDEIGEEAMKEYEKNTYKKKKEEKGEE